MTGTALRRVQDSSFLHMAGQHVEACMQNAYLLHACVQLHIEPGVIRNWSSTAGWSSSLRRLAVRVDGQTFQLLKEQPTNVAFIKIETGDLFLR